MKRNSFPGNSLMEFVTLFIMIAITSCNKGGQNNPTPSPTNNLSITSIQPTTGHYETGVTIKGAGFSSTMANDQVFFNGVAGTVFSANDSVIVATVPKYAGTGNITIEVSGQKKTGPLFTYIYTIQENRYAGAGNPDLACGGYMDGVGTAAEFWNPSGLALDQSGNLYVNDMANGKIREVTPPDNNGDTHVSTYYSFKPGGGGCGNLQIAYFQGLAMNGNTLGTAMNNAGTLTGGTFSAIDETPQVFTGGAQAPFPAIWSPNGAAIDSRGDLYITSENSVFIFYGSGISGWTSIGSPQGGDVDGTFLLNVQNQPVPADEPSFHGPAGIAVDSAGNMYVADAGNNKIRKITPAGVVSTIAGNGDLVEKDGMGTAASFYIPDLISIDGKGNLYVADEYCLRMITPDGNVSTLCSSCFNVVGGMAVDAAGQNIYTTEYWSGVIDKISIF